MALAAVGCDARPAPEAEASKAVEAEAAELADQTFVWWYAEPNGAQTNPKIGYGVAKTSNFGMTAECRAKEKDVQFVFTSQSPPGVVRVRSGEAQTDYPVKELVPHEGIGGHLALAGAEGADPVLQSFLRTGDLSIWYEKGWMEWDADTPDEKQALHAFASRCGLV